MVGIRCPPCCHKVDQYVKDEPVQLEINLELATQSTESKELLRLGGWKSMPFIMGNEACEKLATSGFTLNFISYLQGQYHMHQVKAATFINIITGTASLTPFLGAFISDAYVGRFWIILISSFSNMIACLLLCTSAVVPSLRPSVGRPDQQATMGQLAFLFTAMLFSVVAAGGLRPCTYAFGADQFQGEDTKTVQSYFNWYFFFLYVANLLGATVLVYIQDNIGWGWGFGVPAMAVLVSIVALLIGYRGFNHVAPRGSPFTSLAQVVHAAFHKRHLALPVDPTKLYGYMPTETMSHARLLCLDHAAIPTDEDFKEDGSMKDPWRLCSMRQVEDLKAFARLAPIWTVNMLCGIVLSQHSAFNVPQARTMERHFPSNGSSFEIPAASMTVVSSLTLMLWLPVYDKLVLPLMRRLTGNPRGIPVLQRIGVGFCISLLALVVSGVVESQRRRVARHAGLVNQPHAVVPFSVFWLMPQFSLYGLGESFHLVGQLELLYERMPEGLRSMAGAVFWSSSGVGHYVGILILQLVHRFTGSPDWLATNLNQAHLDYFYYLLAVLECLNLLAFVVVCYHFDVSSNSNSTEDVLRASI